MADQRGRADKILDFFDSSIMEQGGLDYATGLDILPGEFELRFDQGNDRKLVGKEAKDCRQNDGQGDKGEIEDGEIQRGIVDLRRGDAAGIEPFNDLDPGVLAEFPGQLAVPDINGKDFFRATLEQAVGESAA